MPKGKRKTIAPDDAQDPPAASPKKKAAQSAPHRRGGVQRLDEEFKTPSEWHNRLSYEQARKICKARGSWYKDMPKGLAIQAIYEYDLAAGKLKLQQERQERRENERLKKEREEKEKVLAGDSSNDDDDFERLNLILQDVSSSDSSSSSDEDHDVVISKDLFAPSGSRRLFEWVYPGMPSETFSAAPTGQNPYFTTPHDPVLIRQVLYITLDLVTEKSGEKVQLPGRQKHRATADPSTVPSIPRQTREAARNGILQGVLEGAVIERGSDWAQHTSVQGSNGCIYLNLPSPNTEKDLQAVFAKHKELALLRRKKYKLKARLRHKSDSEQMAEDRRHRQKYRNKRRRLKEVYETSRGQCKAMCYMPAYLNSDGSFRGLRHREPPKSRTLDKLFYIRFEQDQLPSYCFWACEGQWPDPSTPNLHFNPGTRSTEEFGKGSTSVTTMAPAPPRVRLPEHDWGTKLHKEKLARYESTWFEDNKAGWMQFLEGLQVALPSEIEFDDALESALHMKDLPEIPDVNIPHGAIVQDVVDIVQLWAAASDQSDLENVFDTREDDGQYSKWNRLMATIRHYKTMQVFAEFEQEQVLEEVKDTMEARMRREVEWKLGEPARRLAREAQEKIKQAEKQEEERLKELQEQQGGEGAEAGTEVGEADGQGTEEEADGDGEETDGESSEEE